MNPIQAAALRDQFAVAITQGYEIWRWTRGRDEDGLPAPSVNESVAQDIWRQADLLVALRPAELMEYPPCPACGWRTLLIRNGTQQVCLRCDTVHDRKPRRR